MLIPMRRFAAGESFFTDWFSVGAGNAIFRALPIDYDSSPTLTLKFYTKNSDETGEGDAVKDSGVTDYSLVLSSGSTMGTAIQEFLFSNATQYQGLKEWIRLQVTVTGSGWMLAGVFDPIFFESATP